VGDEDEEEEEEEGRDDDDTQEMSLDSTQQILKSSLGIDRETRRRL